MSLFDENAAILREMEADGSDLGPARLIDFAHVFQDRQSAEAFARDAEQDGFTTSVESTERAEGPWDAIAAKRMIPSCENVTATEQRLGDLARSHGGRADGWGFLRT